MNRVLYGACIAANVGCLVHVFGEYVAEFTLLVGPSMIPTLNSRSSGDVVITEHITKRWKTLKKGDVVIVRAPQEPNCLICKRLSAMSGDFVKSGSGISSSYTKIPKGHVWLLGDNLEDSQDSRDFGPVPYGLIRGRVCFKIWPPSEFGRIPKLNSSGKSP